MRRKLIAVLLISVLSLSSFYAVAAERGSSSGTAFIPSIGRTITGTMAVESPGRAIASTTINSSYPGVVLTAKIDVKPRNGGNSVIGGEQVAMSAPGGSSVTTGYHYFSANPVTGFSTHHASATSNPAVITLWTYWP